MVIYSTRDDLAIVYEDSGPAYLDYNTTWFYESEANDGSIGTEVIITLNGDLFTDDAANHVAAANVPAGLTPVFERLSATQMRMTFSGQAASHLDGDSRSDIHVYFANEAFSLDTPLTQNAANNFVVLATVNGINSVAADVPTITQDSIGASVVSFTRKNGAAEQTSDDILRFVVTFSGPVTNVDASDFIITGVTDPLVNVWAIDGTSWNVVILGGDLATLNAIVGLNFAPDAEITDAAGNIVTILEPAIDETYTVINP